MICNRCGEPMPLYDTKCKCGAVYSREEVWLDKLDRCIKRTERKELTLSLGFSLVYALSLLGIGLLFEYLVKSC